jgi:2-octaprenyl-6-methoxyphenol hydroxylase
VNTKHVVIIGGGPVGTVLALSLQQQGVPFTLLEARAQGAAYQDGRALALSQAARLVLERLGVWQSLVEYVTDIRTIHVSQRGGLGRTKLRAEDYEMPALGYVVHYGNLAKVLDAKLNPGNVHFESVASEVMVGESLAQVKYAAKGVEHELNATFMVVADGGNSLDTIPGLVRETKEYGHSALVCKVRSELKHNHVAYERFTPQGPIALLPNGDLYSLVWTGEQTEIEALMELEDEPFLQALYMAFGDRVGKFLQVEKRLTFPLRMRTIKPSVLPHLAVIGNAAQTMHPVAGQGFNVGIRDAWTLAKMIIQASPLDLGSEKMLTEYAKQRKTDTRGGMLFTDFLVNTFSNDLVGVSALRGTGLGLLEVMPLARRLLVNRMSYGK